MATLPDPTRLTADEFLRIDFRDKKVELVDGYVRMMTGGTRAHARVQRNLLAFLRGALRGSGCSAYGSDMGLKVDSLVLRYPDISVYCGKDVAPELDAELSGTDPKVLIEVLSPTTAKTDQGEKLTDYQSISSVEAIVFIDPVAELVRTFNRTGAKGWLDSGLIEQETLELPTLKVSIPAAEIFSRD